MLDINRWQYQGGMLSNPEGIFLYNLVAELAAPARIIEIGCYEGKSTIAMLQACADTSGPGPAHNKMVTSVDDFSGDGMTPGESTAERRNDGRQTVMNNVGNWGLSPWLQNVFAMPSDQYFRLAQATPHGIAEEQWSRIRPQVDMFFIDGCHACVKEDMLAAWSILRGGGVIVCHDYHQKPNGFQWISALIDSTGIPGAPVSSVPDDNMLLWRAVKP